MTFYLGTHVPRWLWDEKFAGVPLFVSARRLRARKTLGRALCPWALDSGGFTELSMFGRWTVTPEQYVADVRRWADSIGPPVFAAPQDWMCEPVITEKTGLTVHDHQRLTVENFLTLRRLAPGIPFAPVIQGWLWADYMRHLDDYAAAGIDLAAEPVVGVGSVCRRQHTGMAEELMHELHARGIRAHGFGFKIRGLERCAAWMHSSDSLAWSLQARWSARMPGCTHVRRKTGEPSPCANCARYALQWRDRNLKVIARGERAQLRLF